MFYLIFKYRTTVSPCIDIVNWDLFPFTTTEAACAEPCSCTEMVFNLHKKTRTSVVTDIIKRLSPKLFFSDHELHRSGNSCASLR